MKKARSSDAALEALQNENAALRNLIVAQGGARPAPRPPASALHVAIRNVSSYTIGIPGDFGAPDIDLHPAVAGLDNPASIAVVGYTWWQKIRKSKLYDNGMIVRDDSALDESYMAAPADRPEDLAPNHAKNLVIDADEWILSRNEEELRVGIEGMTSEQSLRRLWAAVDLRFAKELAAMPLEDPARVKKAERKLPAAYQLVEDLVQDRLDELNPLASERARELEDGSTIDHPRQKRR